MNKAEDFGNHDITSEFCVNCMLRDGSIKSCEEIKKFVEDISTWYVRANRNRFNDGEEIVKKVLKEVLNKLSKIIAPIMPFVAEKIYQTIYTKKESVHLINWPKFEKTLIKEKINQEMDYTREIISQGLRERDRNQIGLKWPLAKATIIGGDFKIKKELERIIKSQLNIKSLFYKKSHANTKDIEVDLDTKLNPKLEAEGYAREISRKVQSFRKNLGLEKKDLIDLQLIVDDKFKKMLKNQIKFIKERTNSKSLSVVITKKETFKKTFEFKIKDKEGLVGINY
jgi:isoleucyl-tRNA synthetase